MNFIQNPSFETGDFIGWSPTSNVLVTSEAKHSGLFGAKFSALSPAAYVAQLNSQVLNFQAEKKYYLQFWYKYLNPSGQFYVYLYDVIPATTLVPNSLQWTLFQIEFTPTADFNDELIFWNNYNNPLEHNFYIDDVWLGDTPPPTPPPLAERVVFENAIIQRIYELALKRNMLRLTELLKNSFTWHLET